MKYCISNYTSIFNQRIWPSSIKASLRACILLFYSQNFINLSGGHRHIINFAWNGRWCTNDIASKVHWSSHCWGWAATAAASGDVRARRTANRWHRTCLKGVSKSKTWKVFIQQWFLVQRPHGSTKLYCSWSKQDGENEQKCREKNFTAHLSAENLSPLHKYLWFNYVRTKLNQIERELMVLW